MSYTAPKATNKAKPRKATKNTTVAPLPYPDDIKRLLSIHTYKRPHGSETLDQFVVDFIEPLKDHPNVRDYAVSSDGKQPLAIVVTTDMSSKTIFSAHLDTVHYLDGKQIIAYDDNMKIIYKSSADTTDGKFRDCLGADDGAGIWLLLEMIDAGVPGCYVFHYGEERGGIGSLGMAEHYAEFLKQFDRAIAFDRKGTEDVITHQGMGRCCSDTFADALAASLNLANGNLKMAADDTGIFTDTANYTHLIPECSNVSCGYENAHSGDEYLDAGYLLELRDACILIDWEALPTEREAKKETYGFGNWNRAGFGSDVDDVMQMSHKKLTEWIKNSSPTEIADVIFDLIDRVYAAQDEAYYGQESAFEKADWDDEDERK